eukprot:TRINITY_DN79278_c0_g1_i1.p1 TRINITY_DN79278_c0_g1~~TRINITY_DN79278_c0_g1_i1.p1  ORF type:complete len:210 (+),score=24.59 TRINITY_DN79278_c0_g1_i1:109-738(+)
MFRVVAILVCFTAVALGNAGVRFGHAIPGAPRVDVYANGNKVAFDLGFERFTEYVNAPAAPTDIMVNVAGTEKTLLNVTVTPANGKFYTAVVNTKAGKPNADVYADDLAIPAWGNCSIRFSHQSADTGAVDIYVDNTKILTNVPYGAASPYLSFPAGSAEVAVKPTGTSVTALKASVYLKPLRIYSVFVEGSSAKGAKFGLKPVETEDL